MKSILSALLVLALGAAIGAGIAVTQLRISPWNPAGDNAGDRSNVGARESKDLQPNAQPDAVKFDFGTVVGNTEGSHDFTVTNLGGAPLHLNAATYYSPTIGVTVDKQSVEPGGRAKVTVTWKAKGETDFLELPIVGTNDPGHPQLTYTIKGHVRPALVALPKELVFDHAPAGERSTATARLLCLVDEPLEILDYRMWDSSTAEFFDVSFEPLADRELKENGISGKSGYSVNVAIKPGLPPGRFVQRILLKTNLASAPAYSLPVVGRVTGAITITGPILDTDSEIGWDAERDTLGLGMLSSKVDYQSQLHLMVRGPNRKDVAFKPVSVTPALMKVTLGEATEIKDGTVVQTPLLIRIPAGSPAVNCLGSAQGTPGEIVLETTDPYVTKLRILVQFAIEN